MSSNNEDDNKKVGAVTDVNTYVNASARPNPVLKAHDIITKVAKKPLYHMMRKSPERKAGEDAVRSIHKEGVAVMPDDQIMHATKVAFEQESKKRDAAKKKKKTSGGRRTRRVVRRNNIRRRTGGRRKTHRRPHYRR